MNARRTLAPWDTFSHEKLRKIFTEKHHVVDIGGGLRIDPEKNNRTSDSNMWLQPLLKNVEYKILDKVADYNPDIVADIHDLPFENESVDAFICIAVLEHVEQPWRAVQEMYRTLKKGGYLYMYMPFLFYYHPMPGYYKDFYRFTKDGIAYLTRDFSSTEMHNVRGALSTVANMVPLFSKKTRLFDVFDRFFGKTASSQTSGYVIFCVK